MMTIVDVLQQEVDMICKNNWGKDKDSPPNFIVSILYEEDTHKIILTINHLNSCFSTILFPQPKMIYGYETLEWEMKNLYNQTM